MQVEDKNKFVVLVRGRAPFVVQSDYYAADVQAGVYNFLLEKKNNESYGVKVATVPMAGTVIVNAAHDVSGEDND